MTDYPLAVLAKIKIKKDVPLPPRHEGWTELLRGMEIGDSFFVPAATPQDRNKLTATCSSLARRLGLKVSVRKRTDRGIVGLRVWRVA